MNQPPPFTRSVLQARAWALRGEIARLQRRLVRESRRTGVDVGEVRALTARGKGLRR